VGRETVWVINDLGANAYRIAAWGAEDMQLLRYLLSHFKRVSWERVLSGLGLHNIYMFLRDTRWGEESAWLQEETQHHEPLAVISKAALEGTAALCVQVLDLCVACYGAKAGNWALKDHGQARGVRGWRYRAEDY
jgi:glucokinase